MIMRFHALKSVCLLLFSALIFTACAEDESNTGDDTIDTTCVINDNTIKCRKLLVDADINFIKKYAATITSLDLTSEHTNTQGIITQAQLDTISQFTFPMLDNLSISYNHHITSLDLTKFSTITKLDAWQVKHIIGFNTVKSKLTVLKISETSDIPLTDITDLSNLTELKLGSYSDTKFDLSKLINLTSIDLYRMEKLTTLTMPPTANELTSINLDTMSMLTTLTIPTTAPKLISITMENLYVLTSLDLSNLTNLITIHLQNIADLTTLIMPTKKENLASITLTTLLNLVNLDIFDFINLTKIDIFGTVNSVNNFDISKLTKLTELAVVGTIITIKGFEGIIPKLTVLKVSKDSNIPLTDITDLSNLTELELYDYDNTIIDLSNLTNLNSLDLNSMAKLTSLDLSNLTNLNSLDLNSMAKLTSLDLSALTANLTRLFLSRNELLATLNLGNQSFVEKLAVTGYGNTKLDDTDKITFLQDDNISIKLTIPNINYPTAPTP